MDRFAQKWKPEPGPKQEVSSVPKQIGALASSIRHPCKSVRVFTTRRETGAHYNILPVVLDRVVGKKDRSVVRLVAITIKPGASVLSDTFVL